MGDRVRTGSGGHRRYRREDLHGSERSNGENCRKILKIEKTIKLRVNYRSSIN